MDKYHKNVERLFEQSRTLNGAKLPDVLMDELRSMMEELGLVPISESKPKKLVAEMILPILEEMGYTCKLGKGSVEVEMDDGCICIFHEMLPMVTVANLFLIDEDEESMECLRRAVSQVNDSFDMVKVVIYDDSRRLAIFLHARHFDVDSFKANIQFYIESVSAATERLREQHQHLNQVKSPKNRKTILS